MYVCPPRAIEEEEECHEQRRVMPLDSIRRIQHRLSGEKNEHNLAFPLCLAFRIDRWDTQSENESWLWDPGPPVKQQHWSC